MESDHWKLCIMQLNSLSPLVNKSYLIFMLFLRLLNTLTSATQSRYPLAESFATTFITFESVCFLLALIFPSLFSFLKETQE